MNNNSDPLFNQYADMDFSDAQPIHEIPALAQLQDEQRNKSQILPKDRFHFFEDDSPSPEEQIN